jgi:methyl-accepting chemotaxis protein
MRLSLKSSLTGLFGILLLLTLAQGGLSPWVSDRRTALLSRRHR